MRLTKKHFFFFVIFLIGLLVCNQSKAQQTVFGTVVDSASGTPLKFATVILNDTTNKPIQSASTSSNGEFSFLVQPGAFQIHISCIGYIDKRIHATFAKGISSSLGKIALASSTKLLKEVTIQSQKSALSFRPGQIDYLADNDPRAEGKNGFEALLYAPLVSISNGESIKLNGQSNFKFLLNGKTNFALSSNPAAFLQGLDSKQIERIEVITTPPAKYSAEGIGGIINIITKKSTTDGIFGAINSGSDSYGTSYINGNLSGREGKFGYSVMGTEGWFRNDTYRYFLNQDIDGLNAAITGTTTPRRNSLNLVSHLSYEFTPSDILNIDVLGFSGTGTINLNLNRQGSEVISLEQLKDNTTSVGADYEHKMKNESSFVLSYKYNSETDNDNIDLLAVVPTTTSNENTSYENVIQADYSVHSFDMGARVNLRDLRSDYPGGTTAFQQNVYAAYIGYQHSFNTVNLSSGLRGELADYAINSAGMGGSGPRHFNLFPSLSIDKSFTKSKIDLEFGYSSRISRPQIFYLSPFQNESNPFFTSSGNPSLVPEISQDFELRLTKETEGGDNHILMLTYTYLNNPISNFLAAQSDSVINSTYLNLNGQSTYGFSYNSSLKLPRQLSLSLASYLYYTELQKGFAPQGVSSYVIENKGVYGSFQVNLTGVFLKNYRFSFTNSYNIRDIYLQGTGSGFLYQDLTVNRSFFSKKLRVTVALRQPFMGWYSYKLTYPALYQQSVTATPQRRLFAALRYSFGKARKANVETRQKATSDDEKTKSSLDNIK